MITPEQRKLLSEISNTSYGKALLTYLDYSLAELKDITKTKSWDETLGRQYAVKYIEDLFAMMREKKVNPPKTSQYE